MDDTASSSSYSCLVTFLISEYVTVRTAGTEQQAEEKRHLLWLSGPLHSWNPFCLTDSHLYCTEDFVVVLHWFCSLTVSIVLWVLLNIPTNEWYIRCGVLSFLCFPMAVKWPNVWRMKNIISALYAPCLQNQEKYELSFFYYVFLSRQLGADHYSGLP